MDIKAKIAKILEKAKSTDSEGEAAVLIAKAEELMEKHQIEAFELGDASDPVGMTRGVDGQTGPVAYKTHLQRALASYYGCKHIRIWHSCGKKWHLEMVGAESARITTELMTDFVWKQCNAAGRKLAKEHGGKPGPHQRRVVNALCQRIYSLIEEREQAPKKQMTKAAAENALVVKDQVVALYEKMYPDVTMSKGGKRSTTGAARNAAAGISLNRQTGGTTVKRIGK